jgi:oxygen-independent coproporphyrinogen-3 oxidase
MSVFAFLMDLARKEFKIDSLSGRGRMDFDRPAGLYIHIPFCSERCDFCPYNKVRYDPEVAAIYPQALERELELQGVKSFNSLYIGGGTPTLDMDLLENVINRFSNSVDGELALEVHPADATAEKLERIKRTGIDFVSLGIQSFDDRTLRKMGRKRQNATLSREAIERVVLAGFGFVDVDLIFDFELGSESTARDLEIAMDYGPHQISVYPMMRFTGTALAGTKNDPERELQVLEILEERARNRGYSRDTLWTFKKHGESKRYSSVSREFFLGLGTSASSFNGRQFTTNTFSLDEYYHYIDRGRIPVRRVIEMNILQASLYYSFWALYGGELDLERLRSLFGEPDRRLSELLELARKTGYLRQESEKLVPTKKGYRELHKIEEWLTYNFIDVIWTELREEAAKRPHTGSAW